MRALQYHELNTLEPGSVVEAMRGYPGGPDHEQATLIIVAPGRGLWVTNNHNEPREDWDTPPFPLMHPEGYPTVVGYSFTLVSVPRRLSRA